MTETKKEAATEAAQGFQSHPFMRHMNSWRAACIRACLEAIDSPHASATESAVRRLVATMRLQSDLNACSLDGVHHAALREQVEREAVRPAAFGYTGEVKTVSHRWPFSRPIVGCGCLECAQRREQASK